MNVFQRECLTCGKKIYDTHSLLWHCTLCAGKCGIHINYEIEAIRGVYIITNSDHMKENQFKIGKHTGEESVLLSRYRTYLLDPILIVYQPTGKYTNIIEKNLKNRTKQWAMRNNNGRKTEWRKIPLEILVEKLLDVIMEIEDSNCVKNNL